MKLIHFPDALNQKLGVQNDRLDKVFKTEPDKKKLNFIFFIFKLLVWWLSIFLEIYNFENLRKCLAIFVVLNK